MLGMTDKRLRAAQFRTRLAAAMAQRKLSQTALARQTGVDRSTISQLLTATDSRLPGAQLVAECAAALGVSADWLLSLAEHPEPAADLLAASMSLTEAPRASVDEHIFAWHQEAAGYKIRHVPANLPDILKTEEVMAWEAEPHLGRTTEQAIGSSRDRLAWMRRSSSDYEIAMPVQELESFARAEGYYHGLPRDLRIAQLDHFARLHEQLYPRLRVFHFDIRRVFSAPITVFGPLLAVLYLGQHYLAYRDKDRVGVFSRHFDDLVRDAVLSDRAFPDKLAELRGEI
ncbi:helix-turn-helix domain-containing protein [Oceaniglobus roseus]|uniref:helix-turn-helix domain-containing protein n=1 Tax=Oceaniglobus roseus TaxID=1737570 RepID=UPI000C7EC451|nr:helix-turn-helix transcriptional regulator [Kandeliimicrobium roseum]